MEALTVRKLAASLGTAPMTLHYHVQSKESLIDAMVESVFAEIEVPPEDTDWKQAIHLRCVSARTVLGRHPWAAPLMESRLSPGPANLGHHNAVVGCLRQAGFSVELAAHAYAVLDSYVYGFAFEEATLPGQDDVELGPIADQMAGLLDSGPYPYLSELAREYTLRPGYRFGDSFEFGLGLLLDGLERALRAERRA